MPTISRSFVRAVLVCAALFAAAAPACAQSAAPARNEPDTEEIPEDVRKELEFAYVGRVSDALDATLEKLVAQPPPPATPQDEENRGSQTPSQEPEPVRARPR